MTRAEIAKQRLDEAIRVREAWQIQVGKRRRAWRAAPRAEVERRIRELLRAMEQLGAAKQAERQAWHDWMEVEDGRTGLTL
jgi:hypothetical protein